MSEKSWSTFRTSWQRPVVLVLTMVAVFLCVAAMQMSGGGTAIALAQGAGKAGERTTVTIERKPARVIAQDPYSNFGSVAVDDDTDEVFLSNDNDFKGASIESYHSVFAPSKSDSVTEPLRTISGPKAQLGDICGITISPKFKEIYKVNGDGNGDLGVFPMDANGNVEPIRYIPTSHGAWGIYLEDKFDELFVTVEHVNRLEVYKRTVDISGSVERFIQGPNTQLADPHGVYVDVDKNEIYVINHGHWHETEPGENFLQEGSVPPELIGKRKSYSDIIRPVVPSTGKFLPPSITVYSRTASGDAKPLRVIQGDKTGFDIPLGMVVDKVNHQLVVANAGGDSVLFFDTNATGDVAPVRILQGEKTGLAGPTGVAIDDKRNELWVTNWNNHTATVYARGANGNAAPLRVLRAAPKGAPSAGLGRPGTVAYDPKRKEILIPNCVSHPRISIFAGTADTRNHDVAPVRTIQGQATLMARTTHELAVDTTHDVIVVPNPFAQALLFFRGGAKDEEKPIRIIQGPKTMLGGSMDTDNVSIDNVHNEIYVTQESSDSIFVFDDQANGDVAPIRILHGPHTDMRFPRRVTVDPVNNLMAVVASKGIMLFPRTANGDVAPSCVIAGPHTGLGAGEGMTLSKAMLYPPAKKIIFGGGAHRAVGGGEREQPFMAIWKYGDCGDIAPLYRMKGGTGVFDVNPADKEIIMSGRGNVRIYSMPEAF